MPRETKDSSSEKFSTADATAWDELHCQTLLRLTSCAVHTAGSSGHAWTDPHHPPDRLSRRRFQWALRRLWLWVRASRNWLPRNAPDHHPRADAAPPDLNRSNQLRTTFHRIGTGPDSTFYSADHACLASA